MDSYDFLHCSIVLTVISLFPSLLELPEAIVPQKNHVGLEKLRSVAAMCSGLLRLLLGMCSKISVFVYCTCLWIELESIQSLN